jgi:hypothetical protein
VILAPDREAMRMKAQFAMRLAVIVPAVMVAWPSKAVLALSAVCPGISAVFNSTGAAQSFTVPPGMTQMTIDAAGAAGDRGGNGAELAASFAVTPGETLNIVVGGAGVDGNAGSSNGGGGSFVYTSATETGLLIAAAGGGSGNDNVGNAGNAAGAGGSTSFGGTGGNGGAGGTSGGGGGYTMAVAAARKPAVAAAAPSAPWPRA